MWRNAELSSTSRSDHLKLDAAVTFLDSANGTQRGGLLPDLGASLKSTVVERLIYIDAAARVRQSEVDPFGSRADSVTGANRRTEGSYSISPYIDREIWRDTSLLARHDASLTTNGAGDGHSAGFQPQPGADRTQAGPLGGAIEWTRLDNESKGAQSRFTLHTVRVLGSIEFDQQSYWCLQHNRFLNSPLRTRLVGGVGARYPRLPDWASRRESTLPLPPCAAVARLSVPVANDDDSNARLKMPIYDGVWKYAQRKYAAAFRSWCAEARMRDQEPGNAFELVEEPLRYQ